MGMFQTAVRFDESGTVFEPTCAGYNSMIDIVIGTHRANSHPALPWLLRGVDEHIPSTYPC
jgi:hypothetical protein